MFKRILIPVDPSKPFGAANQYAVDLAHRFGSSIVATYVIDENLMGPSAQQTTGAMDEALEWVGRDAMDDFALHHPDLEVNKSLAYGSTATALFQVVLQTGASALVLGGFRSRAARTTGWGSIAGEIVQHAERPCFIVREPCRLPTKGDAIVVPFDGSDFPRKTLPNIAALAEALGARIDLVHVCSSGHDAEARGILKEGAALIVEQHPAVEVDQHVLRSSFLKSKGRVVLNHAREVNSPLIAISRLGRSSLHTGRSKTVDWLIAHSEKPVWVVRR